MIPEILHRLFNRLERKKRNGAPASSEASPPPDMEPEFLNMYKLCKPFTMTSIERIYALYKAVMHVSVNSIPGEIVECGVWKGGSVMLVAMTLLAQGDVKDIYLYDTFAGMSEPSNKDVDYMGKKALDIWWGVGENSKWNSTIVSMEEVQTNLASIDYPPERFHFIKGKIENTVPMFAPERISVLHLDTDWYESTRHELVHLYPRLSLNGILLVDDYGHFKGARQAVDEYFSASRTRMFLSRVDYTGRIGVKVAD